MHKQNVVLDGSTCLSSILNWKDEFKKHSKFLSEWRSTLLTVQDVKGEKLTQGRLEEAMTIPAEECTSVLRGDGVTITALAGPEDELQWGQTSRLTVTKRLSGEESQTCEYKLRRHWICRDDWPLHVSALFVRNGGRKGFWEGEILLLWGHRHGLRRGCCTGQTEGDGHIGGSDRGRGAVSFYGRRRNAWDGRGGCYCRREGRGWRWHMCHLLREQRHVALLVGGANGVIAILMGWKMAGQRNRGDEAVVRWHRREDRGERDGRQEGCLAQRQMGIIDEITNSS